ncbi:hypothetical protein D3C86_2047110 [compost metagenome]
MRELSSLVLRPRAAIMTNLIITMTSDISSGSWTGCDGWKIWELVSTQSDISVKNDMIFSATARLDIAFRSSTAATSKRGLRIEPR